MRKRLYVVIHWARSPELKSVDTKREEALGVQVGLLYQELRRLAGARLRHERPGHTLQPTALVNEAT